MVRSMVQRIFGSVIGVADGKTAGKAALSACAETAVAHEPVAEPAAGQKRKRAADDPAAVTHPATRSAVRVANSRPGTCVALYGMSLKLSNIAACETC